MVKIARVVLQKGHFIFDIKYIFINIVAFERSSKNLS